MGFGEMREVEVEVRPANGGVRLGVVELSRGGGGGGGTEIGKARRWREREWSGEA